MSGSGISWAICKSALRSRQITMPAPHHSVFLQAGCPSCHPTNSVKALNATINKQIQYIKTNQGDGSRCCRSRCECGRWSESTRWRCAAEAGVRVTESRYHAASRAGADDGRLSTHAVLSPLPCPTPCPASPVAPSLPCHGTGSAVTLPSSQAWNQAHSAHKKMRSPNS